MASYNLKTASEVKSQEPLVFWPQKKAEAMNLMEYVIQAVKVSV